MLAKYMLLVMVVVVVVVVLLLLLLLPKLFLLLYFLEWMEGRIEVCPQKIGRTCIAHSVVQLRLVMVVICC